ncbi:MAG: DEAD/DEAH box helicase [Patescibacteria group bacterium]
MTRTEDTTSSFNELGIGRELLAALAERNFAHPTPIQRDVIPVALEGKDVVGIAETGTGKTLAFGVPMIERLMVHGGQGLILLPTRELALQVEEVLIKLGGKLGLRTAVLIGGASMHVQLQMLRRNPHVVVATPGRLADHMRQKNYALTQIKIVVLDEADRMFDIGFLPEIKRILAAAPKARQTMLFSATMPSAIASVAAHHMQNPVRVEVTSAGTASKNIEHAIFMVPKDAKMQLLEKILADNSGTVLVFSRTKHGAKKIAAGVRTMGHTAVEIHSNRSLSQRRAALEGFKRGTYRVMVATDIAARGIDVSGIALVINYDLPSTPEDYVHRIGRTGRAGATGRALSFAVPADRSDIRQIERLLKKSIPMLPVPVLPPRRTPVVVTHERNPRAHAASFSRGRQDSRRTPHRNESRQGEGRGKKSFFHKQRRAFR